MADVLDRVPAVLSSEPRLEPHVFPTDRSYADGTLTLQGEVGDIAAKKLPWRGLCAR